MKRNSNIVFLQSFSTGLLAKMAQDLLEQHSIQTMFRKEELDAGSEFTNYIGPAELWVLKKDYQRAKRILKLYFRADE
ncbi:MAG: hypothetical protein A2Y62_18765 [Candidatus Fischerbacteria bacterium RBG_13_37_8]|uniref:DUF2007 domain-containing protein n=1 Tax=Candidatus Fischerbacteria bacterium RBG_13_37_8 TaxID=1817863 RepID=A0A1F5VT85_9BACT|nr:MAG: hypothetical protein A2Y62_18765 [Candidatus Fischerbacteria bacterium RBG_13_37_8]